MSVRSLAFHGLRTRAIAALALSVLGLSATYIRPAAAFDFFGLFGGDEPPAASSTALPYDVAFEVVGESDLESSLREASTLYSLRRDAPPDGATLIQRANADFAPLIDAMWGAGYYNARVTIAVAGAPLEIGRGNDTAAIRAADALKGRAPVPVRVRVEPGPLFRLRTVAVLDSATRQPFAEAELPARIVRLRTGDPARSADLIAAQARIVDWFRSQARPLVKVPLPRPRVDHVALSMDITYIVDTGPRAGIGAVTVSGPKTFDDDIVRSFIYLEPGDPYSPRALDITRKSVATIPAVGSVRIREGDRLDQNGNLPIFVEVTERARNLVGGSAGFSTVDGPTGRVFYENRNLFGGAERLRLQGDAFLAPRNNGTRLKEIGDFRTSDIGARFAVSFLKPALGGTRTDLLLDGVVERNRTGGGRFGGYTVRLGGGTAGLRYRIDETLSAQTGVKYERGRTSDVLGNVDYQLVGIPLTATLDTTDKPLDPSTGVRLSATVTPYPTFLGSSVGFTRAQGSGSTYYALDEENRYILAARVGLGTLVGEPDRIQQIPSNYRFYAGGGGSVRGYRYQSIGPAGPFNFTVGGKSLLEGSFEARIKVTDTIGIVPFFDIGGAFVNQTPPLRGDMRMAAGLGLRYYTPIGPIRLDVAVPIDPRRGDKPVALYVSIGQSF